MLLMRLLDRVAPSTVLWSRAARPRRRLACESLEPRTLLAVVAAADSYRLDMGAVLDTERELVPLNATWSYLEANNNPVNLDADFETTWFRKDMAPASYNGPTFRTGVGLFGYGEIDYENPAATELNVPLDPAGRPEPNTAYFTRSFEFAGNPSLLGGLVAQVLADDGAFFYLNGQNVGRVNMGTDDGVYSVRALSQGNETRLVSVDLATQLASGANYLAVSVHGRSFQDTDLGFDMRLRYWREGESVLDNDTSNLVPPPDVKLSVVEVQGQPINAAGDGTTVATNHGTVLMRPNGTFRYSSAAGFVGTDSFTYKAGDGVGVSTLTSVSIRVGLDSTGPTCEELDINASGAVDRRDLATLASLYGSLVQAGATADFNDDGRIGLRDLIYLRDALGQDCGAAAEAVTRHAAAIDRVHSQTAPYRLRASVRRGEGPGGPASSLPAVTEPVDSVSGRVLRARRGAWA